MYHRNYTTYLQKELDFLKLLVVRFHEQEKVNGLELDIALMKTQEVYEQLLRMKPGFEGNEKIISGKTADTPIAVTEITITEPVQQPEPTKKEPSVPVAEEPIPEPPEKEFVPVAIEPKSEPVVVPVPEKIVLEAEKKIEEPTPVREEKKQPSEPVKAGILAEKISPSDFHPINETLAQKTGDLSRDRKSTRLNSSH